MKLQILYTFIALLFLSIFTECFSQDSVTRDKSKTEFKLGVYYNSNLNYYGRTDSLKSAGIFPLAELWVNNSFYINAAPIFVSNDAESPTYAGTVATIGYRYERPAKDVFHFFVVKPFYRTDQLVQSALKAQLTAQYTVLSQIVNLSAGADLKLSDNIDYGLSGGLDRLFRVNFSSDLLLAINPTANISAGTQRFSKTYYKRNNFLIFPGAEEEVTEEFKQLKILSYEFSVPLVLRWNKVNLIAIPAYVIPQNLLSVPNRPDLSERGGNLFYTTVGIKYNF